MKKILSMILAGGEGTRLYPLTKDRSKPAVPIAGNMRIIDFALTNLVRSGFQKIKVLTQTKADSLIVHLNYKWNFLPRQIGEFIDPVPAQRRLDEEWYKGTADAVYQNMNLIRDENCDHVGVFSGDHVYFMDLNEILEFGVAKNSDVVVSAIRYTGTEVEEFIKKDRDKKFPFGVIQVDENGKMTGFQEKPEKPTSIPGTNDVYASMGNYFFKTPVLTKVLSEDAEDEKSEHDFGRNILPKLLREGCSIYVYNSAENFWSGRDKSKPFFWSDVGNIDQYYETSMSLRYVDPPLNMYSDWNIKMPPSKTVFCEDCNKDHVLRQGRNLDSLVSEGVINSGGTVIGSVLSPRVRVNSYSLVENSVLFDNVIVRRHSRIKNAIIDKNVIIPEGTFIGYDLEKDKERGFHITEGGIIVIYKEQKIEK